MKQFHIEHFETPEEAWDRLTPAMRKALLEIDDGSYAGGWCGARRITLERLQEIGTYSDVPALVATGKNGALVTTEFGYEVAWIGRTINKPELLAKYFELKERLRALKEEAKKT